MRASKSILTDAGRLCPLCDLRINSTCPSCGLWWLLKREVGRFPNLPPNEAVLSLRLSLRPRIGAGAFLFVVGLATLAFSAALGGVWSLVHEPTSVLAWASAFVGVGLGGFVGTMCLASLATQLLHAALPGYLEGSESQLRVRTWTSQEGRMMTFHRTDVVIPRDQLEDVGFINGQSGEPMLFLVHSSGHSFGTGWSGTKDTAAALAAQLSSWVEFRP